MIQSRDPFHLVQPEWPRTCSKLRGTGEFRASEVFMLFLISRAGTDTINVGPRIEKRSENRLPLSAEALTDSGLETSSCSVLSSKTLTRVTRSQSKATTAQATPSGELQRSTRASERAKKKAMEADENQATCHRSEESSSRSTMDGRSKRRQERLESSMTASVSSQHDPGEEDDPMGSGTSWPQQENRQPASGKRLHTEAKPVEEDDEDDILPRAGRRQQNGLHGPTVVATGAIMPEANVLSNDDEGDARSAMTPKRRHLARAEARTGKSRRPSRTEDEDEELRMDLEDLQGGSDC